MWVLQLIDTLRSAGAERVAVNYANALVPEAEKSFLCTTRQEGPLRELLNDEVGYLFLHRQKTFDRAAFNKLCTFIKTEEIDIIHAHATSYFLGWAVKMRNPNVVLIWHAHHGHRAEINSWKHPVFKLFARSCSAIITVNEALREWATHSLKHGEVHYIKNFILASKSGETVSVDKFPGKLGKRIVCVANLRPQKNHGMLLDAFAQVLKKEPEASLHLFGLEYDDIYSSTVQTIAADDLKNVYYHGTRPNIDQILPFFDLGVLSSDSEGLPLALLEYGQAALPVVVTDVGQCAEVVNGNGSCIPAGNAHLFAKELIKYLSDPEAAKKTGLAFQREILANYGKDAILPQVMKIYEQALQEI